MPLFTTKAILQTAYSSAERFCVPAFNVHNMEYTKAVIAAAEKEQSPVILMLGQPILAFAGLDTLANIAMFAARNTRIPAAVMLDHGSKEEIIDRSMELGLSIMIDGSHYQYDENVEFTRSYTEKAHRLGLSVEAELGALAGSEDGEEEVAARMTDPDMAADFVGKTGIDILAVSIGNVHGLYKGRPNIDVSRFIEIRKRVSVPIVMHGGSDLPSDIVNRLIDEGMSKFNIGTDLKIAFSSALREILSQEPLKFQPFDSLQYAMNKTEETAREKIRMFRASGKSRLYSS